MSLRQNASFKCRGRFIMYKRSCTGDLGGGSIFLILQTFLVVRPLMADEWAMIETGLWSPSECTVRCWHKPRER